MSAGQTETPLEREPIATPNPGQNMSDLRVNWYDLLFSLSDGMDRVDPSLVDHQLRTAWVASELARAAGLDDAQTERLFIAAMLHDIGALSPEEKVSGHVVEDLDPVRHCQRGGKLFREVTLLQPSAQLIDWHHTTMQAHRSAGRDLSEFAVLGAQILYLSDHLERAIRRNTFILDQSGALRARIEHLADHALHPDVVGWFVDLSKADSFWLRLVATDLSKRLRESNFLRPIELDYQAFHPIARVLKDITDFRSRFTVAHSAGVAACAAGLGAIVGLGATDLQRLWLAGLMHDIGKLMVPDAILRKTASLTREEFAIVQQHPFFTYRILSRVRGCEQIAQWAAFHHERLDGSGYGEKRAGTDLDLGAKIMAVADIAMAIAERRPYRAPGDQSAVLNALREMSCRGLIDPVMVEAFADNYGTIMKRVQRVQAAEEARYFAHYAMI